MTFSTPSPLPQPRRALHPPLEAGDHLDQRTFHERYEAMPVDFHAELIGGIVYVRSRNRLRHGRVLIEIACCIGTYQTRTPRTDALRGATHILGDDSEPQPDVSLLVVGGQTEETGAGYMRGAPEFVAEVATSSAAYDLHSKKRDYERHGVQEYLVLVLHEERAAGFVREGGRFTEHPPGPDGIHRSRIFPGLWLDAAALLRGETARVLDVLNQGLASPEHAAFAASIGGVGRLRG